MQPLAGPAAVSVIYGPVQGNMPLRRRTDRAEALDCINRRKGGQTMNRRIYMLRKKLRLSQTEFAKKIGLTQNSVSHMEKNGSTVKEYNIKSICAQFDVNENWLRSGKGQMFSEKSRKRKELCAIFEQLSPIYRERLIEAARNLRDI